jgi:hypothetical protein
MAQPEPYRNRNWLRQRDPRLTEALDDLTAVTTRLTKRTGTQLARIPSGPPAPSALTVTGQDGIFDAKISDSNAIKYGIGYFLEYSTTPNFTNPIPIDLGAARNWRGMLGNLTLYWRCYSQYWGAETPSEITYFGTQKNPTAVVGGGVNGPTPQTSSGSGTAKGDGSQGGSGFGTVLDRPSLLSEEL